MEILFETDALKIEALPGNSLSRGWVTFGALGPSMAFGQKYLTTRSERVVFFIPKQNHWYQVPEIWDALNIANLYLSNTETKICYGSSMGGFAAIAYAKEIEAQTVIAAAPQYSIDPNIVGHFDKRWSHIGEATNFIRSDARDGLSDEVNLHLIYDPFFKLDSIHVAKIIENKKNYNLYKFPLGGHGGLHSLLKASALKHLIDGIVLNDKELVIQAKINFKKSRKTNSDYFYSIGEMKFSKGEYYSAAKYALYALKIHPWAHYIYELLSRALWATGDKFAAIEADKKCVEFMPNETFHYVRLAHRYISVDRPHHAINLLSLAPDDIKKLLKLIMPFIYLINIFQKSNWQNLI